MASESEEEAAARLSMGSAGSGDPEGRERAPSDYFPIIVGVMRSREEGGDAAAAQRIVLVNPLTQGMVVLRSSDGRNIAALMQEILASDGGADGGPPPASKASIEAMRTVAPPPAAGGDGDDSMGEEQEEEREEEEEECAVCLDGLWASAVKEMPCRHRFHGECIEKWLGMHGSCPVCRYQMPEEGGGVKKGGGDEEEEMGAERWRSVVEREIWVSLGFGGGDQDTQQQQQQQQQQQEEGN